MYTEIQGNDSNNNNSQSNNRNSTKLSNVLEIKVLSSIIYFVAIGVIGAGLIITYSGLASNAVAPTYIDLIGIMTPALLVLMALLKKIPAHVYIIMSALVLSLTSAIMTFFDVIAYSRNGDTFSKGGFGAASAGSFFIFAGETAITVASFFTFLGIF